MKPIKRFIRNRQGTFPAVVIPESTYKKLVKDKKRLEWLEKYGVDLMKSSLKDFWFLFGDEKEYPTARAAIDSAMNPNHSGGQK